MEDKQGDEVTKNVALDDSSPLSMQMNVQGLGFSIGAGPTSGRGPRVRRRKRAAPLSGKRTLPQMNVQDSFNEIGFSKGTKPGLNDEGIDVTDGELRYRGAGSQGDGTQEKTSLQVCQSQSSGEERRDESLLWMEIPEPPLLLGDGELREPLSPELLSSPAQLPSSPSPLLLELLKQMSLDDDGLRQRRGKKSEINAGNDWITTETESLETGEIRRQAASASENVEGGGSEEWPIDMPPDNHQAGTQEMSNNNARNSQRLDDGAPLLPARTPEEPNNNARNGAPVPPARTPEERRRQQFRCLIWRLILSLFGHGILLVLSFIFGFGEETSGHHEEGNSRKWLKWGVMNLIFPLPVFIVMAIVQFLIDLDDIPADRVEWCKKVNLAAITGSKVVYSAIRELPGVNVKVRFITAHAVAVVIDMASAVYLYLNHGCLDQDFGG